MGFPRTDRRYVVRGWVPPRRLLSIGVGGWGVVVLSLGVWSSPLLFLPSETACGDGHEVPRVWLTGLVVRWVG